MSTPPGLAWKEAIAYCHTGIGKVRKNCVDTQLEEKLEFLLAGTEQIG